MIHISVKHFKTLAIILLILSTQIISASDWPIKNKIDLSSGFGDFRTNRFHTGVDIRTGGRTGTKIFAPVSGYIHRIRTAYTGYGKGLYLQGDDGFIYVFGHLLDFEPKTDSLLKSKQRESKRYFQDISLSKEQLKFQKGDLLGYTGQTGAGAPHLHFEKRTSQNFPINPLTNGFKINDKTKPIFDKIGFKMLDDYSLFDNALRDLEFTPNFDSKSQNYFLDTLLYFNKPFGLFTGVYDRMREGGMQQSVYKLTLLIDKKEFYSTIFEELDFETQHAVNFRYKYAHAVNNEKRVQRLYNALGEDFKGSGSKNNSQGIIGFQNNISYGHHKAEIIAEDAFGNKSTLKFNFIYGSVEELYQLDSHTVANHKDHSFYFTPSEVAKLIAIDSVVPHMNRGELWGKPKEATIEYLKSGQVLCKMSGVNTTTTTIRLFAYSKNTIIRDNVFSGFVPKGKLSVQLSYEILEDGILVNLKSKARQSADSRIELFYKDSLLDVIYPQFFNMETYACFIPPLEKYKNIDKIGYALSKDTTYKLQYTESLNIHLVGHKDNHQISLENITFEFEKDNFFKPRFLEIKRKFYLKGYKHRLLSSIVDIFPRAFICKSNFKMKYSVPRNNPFFERTGFAWYDEDNEDWIWIENQRDNYDLSSQSTGGGTFVVLYDLVEPTISNLNILDGRTFTNKNFKVTFKADDDLSGFTDDQSFIVKIDKEWLIPEYDPETKIFIARPAQQLSPGKHHFGIQIVDKVGNKTEQYLNFFFRAE